jgi:hypothetical protein
VGPEERDFKSKYNNNHLEKISARLFNQFGQLFFLEFSSLDSNPQCQGNSGTGTSIFLPFNLEITGVILFDLASEAVYLYSIVLGRMDAHAASLAETNPEAFLFLPAFSDKDY